MKIPYVKSGDGPNNPLNKEWINSLVWAANAFLNMKVRIDGKEYTPIYTENGCYINLSGDFNTTGSITVISGSASGSFSGSIIFDRSDVWQ
jgi:hypothetical protein